jgi:hypothetical protein
MPNRWAIQNGNWSNLAIWNNSASLGFPTASDDIFTNSFNVNVDQSFSVISLNNTARARDIATPQMTSDSTPNPFNVFASTTSQTFGSAAPWFAFDRNTSGTRWLSGDGQGVNSWIAFDFGAGNSVVIDGYTIFGTNSQGFNPRTWNFEASTNAITWVNLGTISLPAAIAANGSNVQSTVGNSTAYRYYRIFITQTGGSGNAGINELELYRPGTSALAAGGSFSFNTAGVTGSITGVQPIFQSSGNVIQITAATGTVTLTTSASIFGQSATQIINHSGNCTFVLNTSNVNCNGTVNAITKGSAGTIILNCDLLGAEGTALTSTAGTTIVNGNCIGSGGSFGQAISQNAGTVIVNGNVIGSKTTTNGSGITFSGAQLTVNGTVSGSNAIATSSPFTFINGRVIAAGTIATIISTTANQIFVSGSVTSSSTNSAISMTNANGQVSLNGNMVNTGGRMAIFSPIIWTDGTGTTQAEFFTSGGGGSRILYSETTFPNTPAVNNVRSGTIYGAGNSLTGTCVMPVAANSRNGVIYDNGTVGTALFTTSLFLTELSSSTTPVAVRMQNLCTPMILGELMEAYKR